MRSNKGLGRKTARAIRIENEAETDEAKTLSVYHVRLAHKFARSPLFRRAGSKVVLTTADVKTAIKGLKKKKKMTGKKRRELVKKLRAAKETK